MRHIALLLLCVAVAHASVTVTRTSSDGPHPSTMELEVTLPHTNQKVLIPLARSDAFENVPMTVMENQVSRTFSAHQVHHSSHAHYRDIESRSVVSVRHVNGQKRISGHVMHEGTSYFLEPVGDSEHRVAKNVMKPDLIAKQVDKKRLLKFASRRKRQSTFNLAKTDNVVEILLLIDHTVWNGFKTLFTTDDRALTELHFYYTHILTGVDTAYRNIRALSISVSCIGIFIAKTAADSTWLPPAGADANEASIILGAMKTYSVGKSADHIMAFTRTDIRSGTNSAVCGMAYVSGACTDLRQSINEDQGLHSWGTAAHELAHNLASDHDPNDATGCSQANKYLMSPSAGSYSLADVSRSYRFSDCTIASIQKYVTGLGASSCLKTAQGTQVTALASTVPEGTRLTLNQVCQLSFPGSAGKIFLTDDVTANPANICAKIFCTTGDNRGTTSGGLRAPAGTPCGNQKSCNWEGACTADPAAPAADEACFWGDAWDQATCEGWLGYVKYQRDSNDLAGAKDNCNSVRSGCCKSLKTVCTF